MVRAMSSKGIESRTAYRGDNFPILPDPRYSQPKVQDRSNQQERDCMGNLGPSNKQAENQTEPRSHWHNSTGKKDGYSKLKVPPFPQYSSPTDNHIKNTEYSYDLSQEDR